MMDEVPVPRFSKRDAKNDAILLVDCRRMPAWFDAGFDPR
jgi:hypothetical protein